LSKPLLSILVATVPNRIPEPASSLFAELCRQALGRPAEVLLLGDNRARTLGEKMDALLSLARGVYTVFVDDDDTVSESYLKVLLTAIALDPIVDVINYDVRVTLEDGSEAIVRPSLLNPNEEFKPGGIVRRKPLQTSVWRADLSKSSRWGVGQYNVDAAWAAPLWDRATTERNIPEVLYHYRRHIIATEAI